ncbi:MAG TPA: HEAT repeat domain-containing protein, partial [Planctomycetota bacterium]|nr:HEAT repeat domain-containing protein [Planctomycetota bacterium]
MGFLLALVLCSQGDDLDALRAKLESEKGRPSGQRLATLDAVAALGTEPALQALEEVYDRDRDLSVRGHALKLLAKSGTVRGRAKLAAVGADRDAPSAFRAEALEALTDPPAKDGFELARSVAREPGEIRLRAWTALRRYPLEQTQPMWRIGLQDADPAVRGLSLAALAPLKELRLQELAKKELLDPVGEPLVKYGCVLVLREADGIANARVLLAAAAAGADTTLQRLLGQALGSNTDDKAPEAIYQGLRHADPAVRAVAAGALGTLKHDRALDRLTEPLKDKVPEVRLAALEAVAERREKSSEFILQREAQRSDEELAAPAIALLPAYPSDATRQLLLKLAGHYKVGIAVCALQALGEIGAAEALPAFEKALRAKDWPLRVVAVRALARLRTKEAVDLLVARCAEEEGRLLAEIVDVLRALTGQGIGYAPGQWKEWWTRARDAFAFGAAAAKAPDAGGVGATTYHGIPVLSTRIVFLLDISGSMAEAGGGESRLERAKKELSRTLSGLSKDAQVNLVFFDDRIEPWHNRQLRPLKSDLKEALAIVARAEPRGSTNIFDALELAFQHREVDTIFLLSDGEPSHGRIVEPTDILREVRRANRTRQIAVHTI